MDRVRSPAWIIFFIILAFPLISLSKEQSKINLISWWGYISKADQLEIQKLCKKEVSIDEYFSNSEFLRRWESNNKNYDIIIYSNTIQNAVKEKINNKKLFPIITKNYHPLVQKKLAPLRLPSHTRILSLGFTGFLWNTDNFKFSPSLSLEEMLNLANNKTVVILDDPMEGMQILDSLNYFNKSLQKKDNSKAKIIISNDMEHLVAAKDFSFAYHWSGGAIQHIRKSPNKLNFMIHPKLSQVTADLVSLNNQNSKEALCIFDYLSSKEFTSRVQAETAYFSPYGPKLEISDANFKKIYENYFLDLDHYQWLTKPKEEDFKKIDKRWKILKSELNDK